MKIIFLTILLFVLSEKIFAATDSNTILSSSSEKSTDNKSSASLSEILGNKKFAADKDITDPKLQADFGSLSRYSVKFNLTYSGPPVGDLNNKYQPNPDGVVAVNQTAIGGSINGRYRLSSKDTISVGTGVSVLTPVQGAERYDVKNPFISYDHSSKILEAQMRNSLGVSLVTIPDYNRRGEYAGLSYDNSLVRNLGSSGFAVGVDTSISYYLFNRDYVKKDGQISRYTFAMFPAAKYLFNDQWSLSTSLAYSYWSPRYLSNEMTWKKRTVSQRLGFGWAYSRDVYVSPYLNFYPNKLTYDLTTINISTTFSLL